MPQAIRHVLVTGGIYHDFAATAEAFAKAIEPMGVRTNIVTDAETALSGVNSTNCDLLTIDALLFTMTQQEKYAPLREQYAFQPSARARGNVERYVRSGGSLLGLHTASICFDGWAEWANILGAGWVWGQSSHPAAGKVSVERMVEGDDIVADAPPFEVFDEVYRGLVIATDAEAVLRARAESDSEFHPVMWRHRYGAGRVIYDALGHGPDSIIEPTHLRILKRAVQWLIEPALTNKESRGNEAHA